MLVEMSYRPFFTEYLPSIMGRMMLDDVDDLTTCIEIVITDDPGPTWRLVVTEGRLTHVGHDGPEPDCSFHSDEQTFLELASARLSPANAFMELRVDVTGDLEIGMRLSFALEEFFHRYPYTP